MASHNKNNSIAEAQVDFTEEELDKFINDPTSNIKFANRIEYKGSIYLNHATLNVLNKCRHSEL